MSQLQASPHTISSYRDTFRLLLRFAQQRLHKPPSQLAFAEIDAPLIAAFLDELEKRRNITARSRNLRLTAIRSFFTMPHTRSRPNRLKSNVFWRYPPSATHSGWSTSWIGPKLMLCWRRPINRLGSGVAITLCCCLQCRLACAYQNLLVSSVRMFLSA